MATAFEHSSDLTSSDFSKDAVKLMSRQPIQSAKVRRMLEVRRAENSQPDSAKQSSPVEYGSKNEQHR